METMDLIMDVIGVLLRAVMLYCTLVGVFCLLPAKRIPRAAVPRTRFAVLLPARNEEAVIQATVESLLRQHYPRKLFDIYVVPNNCTDGTEAAALAAGAQIIRCDAAVRNKGGALHDAFEQLLGSYDAYCVFDADNIVHHDFLARMDDAIQNGAEAAKGRQVAMNPYDSWVSGCYELYFESFHLLYNRPRARLGLSAKLVGTGFAVTDKLMRRLGGWNTETMAEDAEFSAQCAAQNVQVVYVPQALTYDEEPVTFRQSLRQRRRWSGGVLAAAKHSLPALLRRPSFRSADCAVFLSMIYVQLAALVPALYTLLKLPSEIPGKIVCGAAVFIVSAVLQAALFCLMTRHSFTNMLQSILLYPVFMASWYPLHIASVICPPRVWKAIVHSGRGGCRLPATGVPAK